MAKDLKEKAVDIKGKKYVLVADRIIYFNETFKNGSISTELITPVDSALIIIKATVRPDLSDSRAFTAYSQAIIGEGYINKTSALENAETSAVGRALAFMGIGVIESVASVDEINKTTHYGKQITTSEKVSNFMQDLEPTDEEVVTWIEKLESARDLKELKAFALKVPPLVKDRIGRVKFEEIKKKLS